MKFKAKLTKFNLFSGNVEGDIELIDEEEETQEDKPTPPEPEIDETPAPEPPIDVPGNPELTDLVDKAATAQTMKVYKELQEARGKYVYFGQMEYCFNHQWRLPDQSFKMTGKHPKVLGVDKDDYDLTDSVFPSGGLIGKEYFESGIRKHADAGGYVMFMSGMPNLVGTGEPGKAKPKARNDRTGDPVNAFLPGGSHRNAFVNHVKKLAHYFANLKDSSGKPIPVLYRLFHEMDGSWDWWGTRNSTPEKFKKLWIDVFNIFKSQGTHNIIWVWAPGFYKYHEGVQFDTYYPGNDYVDIIGVDRYEKHADGTAQILKDHYYTLPDSEAKKRGKVFIIAEGMRKLSTGKKISKYWTDGLMLPVKRSIQAGGIQPAALVVYFTMRAPRWGPRVNQWDSKSFVEMVKDPFVKMLGD